MFSTRNNTTGVPLFSIPPPICWCCLPDVIIPPDTLGCTFIPNRHTFLFNEVAGSTLGVNQPASVVRPLPHRSKGPCTKPNSNEIRKCHSKNLIYCLWKGQTFTIKYELFYCRCVSKQSQRGSFVILVGINHELNFYQTETAGKRDWQSFCLFFLWRNTKDWSYDLKSLFMSFFCVKTKNVPQKSHSVNMCIIIHSLTCIVCLLWPHFQRPQKQASGVGSSKQRPFFPTRLGLRNAHHSAGKEPFTGLLAAHEWQMNHQEPFPSIGAAVTTL